MFQGFEETGDNSHSAERLALLRQRIGELGVDGFIVPRSDEHQGEYIAPSAARLAWLTGFTGSAGDAVVLKDSAAILVDGRYTLQVRGQVDQSLFQPVNSVETALEDYLVREAKGLRIGFDPWLHTLGQIRALREVLKPSGGTLVPLRQNPIDGIWTDRPSPPSGLVDVHPETFAGQSATEKLREMQAALREAKGDAAVLTDPASIAWLFNIRGSDVPHTPLPLSFAILRRDARPSLFIDGEKLPRAVAGYLAEFCDIAEPHLLEPELRRLSADAAVLVDPALVAERIAELVLDAGGRLIEKPDPARLPRARKNAAELAGARAAHRRDGAAVASFLYWLEKSASGGVTEISATQKLEEFRSRLGETDGEELRDISFDTIAGSGPNGAIVHYRVNDGTNRRLREGELFLVDSGGQYRDGTTDVTRTVAVGAPSPNMRRMFTLVLKAMIAISTARFPEGTRGVDLDPLARIALWKAGVDYAHGTGHGVGSYLAVHEGPQSISRRGMAKLETGMIVSNEPGYYREGAFGIRIENLVLVEPPRDIEDGDRPMHAFETLTLAPIDRRLIDGALLTPGERQWLDGYHARVRDELTPLLQQEAAAWLADATAALS